MNIGGMSTRKSIRVADVRGPLDRLFGEDFHAKRVESMASGVVGIIESRSLGIHLIGRGLAAVEGLCDKHAVKQIDRLVGNEGIDVELVQEMWCRHSLEGLEAAVINLDWTDFDADDHTMLMASVQTSHGRSRPLMWKTVKKSKLRGRRNGYEDELLTRLRATVPSSMKVTIVADRGFMDSSFMEYIDEMLGFSYILRIRSNVYVTDSKGECRTAQGWLNPNGRMRTITGGSITAEEYEVAKVVIVKDKGMKAGWFLVSNDDTLSGSEIKKLYGKRFSCEETFRDLKNGHRGWGMSQSRIKKESRRDRLVMLAVLAMRFLESLGEAGERCGLDRTLYASTAKRRQLSLLRQGLRWYDLIPNMPAPRFRKLMKAWREVLEEQADLSMFIGVYAK